MVRPSGEGVFRHYLEDLELVYRQLWIVLFLRGIAQVVFSTYKRRKHD